MFCKFPYFEGRPHIPVVIENNSSRKRFLPLLDSGADFSVFYKADAIRLGLNWSEGKAIKLSNADETEFNAKEFNLKLNIEGQHLNARICFIDTLKIGTPLLGRQNIFDQFKILVNEKENYVQLESH